MSDLVTAAHTLARRLGQAPFVHLTLEQHGQEIVGQVLWDKDAVAAELLRFVTDHAEVSTTDLELALRQQLNFCNEQLREVRKRGDD